MVDFLADEWLLAPTVSNRRDSPSLDAEYLAVLDGELVVEIRLVVFSRSIDLLVADLLRFVVIDVRNSNSADCFFGLLVDFVVC